MTRVDENFISSKELTELSGASYRQVDHWRRIGLIDKRAGRGGSGNAIYFFKSDIILSRLISVVSERLSMKKFNSITRELKKLDITCEDYNKVVLIIDGECQVVSEDRTLKELLIHSSSVVVAISLSQVFSEEEFRDWCH